MTTDEIRKLADAKPFRPFEFELRDGSTALVPARDHLFIPPNNTRDVIVAEGEGPGRLIEVSYIVAATQIRRSRGHRNAGRLARRGIQ